MQKLMTSCLRNMARAKLGVGGQFEPVLAALYVTPLCNLRCGYCELFGSHRNAYYRNHSLDLARLKRIVALLVHECQILYITGGEPTLRPDIGELLAHARSLGLPRLAMNTNGLLLHLRPEVLAPLTHLVVSLDSVTQGRRDSSLARRPQLVAQLLDNIRWVATQQRPRRFTLTLTCVVTPGRVREARQVMELCFDIGAEFSIQHLTEERVRSAALARDPEFPAFVTEMIAAKRQGLLVSGSELYLRTVRDRIPFACVPTAVPHVDHMGRLSYPCRELRDHVLVDLLRAGSLRTAQAEGLARYGPPPRDCSSCPDRCYAEISSLIRHPSALAREVPYLLRWGGVARVARPLAV